MKNERNEKKKWGINEKERKYKENFKYPNIFSDVKIAASER